MPLFKRKPKPDPKIHADIEELEGKLVGQLAAAIKEHDRLVVALATKLEVAKRAVGEPTDTTTKRDRTGAPAVKKAPAKKKAPVKQAAARKKGTPSGTS